MIIRLKKCSLSWLFSAYVFVKRIRESLENQCVIN